MVKQILPIKVELMKKITKYMLAIFAIFQAGGLWLIYSDVNYSISNIDPETMQIPKVVHNSIQSFIYGSSVSMASGFGAVVLGAAWKMRRPYKNKALFFLYLGFALQILFIALGFVSAELHHKPLFSLENIGLLTTILWTMPVILRASNKVVWAWSVELIENPPLLPDGSYSEVKGSSQEIKKNNMIAENTQEDSSYEI